MTDQLTTRLKALYTGVIYDCLSDQGLADQALPHTIQGLATDHRVAGRVWTASGVRTPSISRDDSLLRWTEFLSAAPKDHVVVCQPNDSTIAHMGELSSETLKSRGVLGYVVDGGCRDVQQVLDQAFPVFCRYTTPADIAGRWRPDELGTAIRIGQTDIVTGDYVIGDQDGVVIIPGGMAEDIVSAAETAVSSENKVRTAILAGEDPKQAYLKYGKF